MAQGSRTARPGGGRPGHLNRFIAECCVVDDRRVVYADDLRRRYEAWCAARGETPLSGQAVGAGLRLQGFERIATGLQALARSGAGRRDRAGGGRLGAGSERRAMSDFHPDDTPPPDDVGTPLVEIDPAEWVEHFERAREARRLSPMTPD